MSLNTLWILEEDIARRRELIRISEVAIALHEDRIAGHRQIIASETAEIERLENAIVHSRKNAHRYGFGQNRQAAE